MDTGYFSDRGRPVRLCARSRTGRDGGNGVYAYGADSTFPTSTFNGTNYWVDVVFVETLGPDTTAPLIGAKSPDAGAQDVSLGTKVTVTFSEAMDRGEHLNGTINLSPAPGGAPTVAYDAGTKTATLTPRSLLSPDTLYTVTVVGGASGVKDLAGNALAATAEWSFRRGCRTRRRRR